MLDGRTFLLVAPGSRTDPFTLYSQNVNSQSVRGLWFCGGRRQNQAKIGLPSRLAARYDREIGNAPAACVALRVRVSISTIARNRPHLPIRSSQVI